MKVLYIVSTLGKSGPTNQLYNIIENLDKSKFTPHILTLSPEPKHSYINRFQNIQVEIESLNLSRVKGMLVGASLLKEKVKAISPQIIHTQGLRADELSAKCLSNYKRVATLRNYPFEDYMMKFNYIKGTFMARKHIKAIRNLPKVIACSRSLAELFSENQNILMNYIQNGVNQSKFYEISLEEKRRLKQELGIDQNKRCFITVGSLIERKDPLTLIKAFNQVDDYLLIIGDGPLYEECKNQSNKNIIYIGNTDEVNKYLNISDYFVSASLSEGLPNTVIEALAVGLPILLSDIPQHREILDFNSDAGLLFSFKNEKELLLKIEKIKSLEYTKQTLASKKIINNHLDAKIMSRKYQKLYCEMVNVNV